MGLPYQHIIEEDFEIPQLRKRRKIWALLPADYEVSSKQYPVLYLQDAQNLMNPLAPFGNWALDLNMAKMKESGHGDLIIVAIEHGGKERLREYMPFDTNEFGKGEGKSYARFLVETLKPYVDQKFRTRQEREYTGIGGSSMGGLISAYTGLTYNEVFSKWMIFSPSLWISNKIYRRAIEFANQLPTSIYLYGGQLENDSMEDDLRLLKRLLESKGWRDSTLRIKLSIHPEGEHSERFWGIEFPQAIRWLFFNRNNDLNKIK